MCFHTTRDGALALSMEEKEDRQMKDTTVGIFVDLNLMILSERFALENNNMYTGNAIREINSQFYFQFYTRYKGVWILFLGRLSPKLSSSEIVE